MTINTFGSGFKAKGNPLNDMDLDEPIIPQKIDYKAKDTLLYNTWNETKSKKNMSNLVGHLSPLIYKEVSRASGTLPVAALNSEGKIWAIKAIKTFDPDKGFALSTHVTNYLQRVRRMNYKYQHAVRPPENVKREFHKFENAKMNLTDELNRDPSEEEMAERLGWSKGAVTKFGSRIYSEYLESGDPQPAEVVKYTDDNLLMDSLMSRLTPEEKLIVRQKGKMPAGELAEKLGVNTNRLNYLQSKLVSKIQGIKMELGL